VVRVYVQANVTRVGQRTVTKTIFARDVTQAAILARMMVILETEGSASPAPQQPLTCLRRRQSAQGNVEAAVTKSKEEQKRKGAMSAIHSVQIALETSATVQDVIQTRIMNSNTCRQSETTVRPTLEELAWEFA
jgi:hypothetical protein